MSLSRPSFLLLSFFRRIFSEYSEKILSPVCIKLRWYFHISISMSTNMSVCVPIKMLEYSQKYSQNIVSEHSQNILSEHYSERECIKSYIIVSTYRKRSESQNREQSEKRPIENVRKFSHRESIGKKEYTCQSTCSVFVTSYLLLP